MTEQELWALVNTATLGAWEWMHSTSDPTERKTRSYVYMELSDIRDQLDR